jgi:hypothetical protein
MKRRTFVSGLGLIGLTEAVARSTPSEPVSNIRGAFMPLDEAFNLAPLSGTHEMLGPNNEVQLPPNKPRCQWKSLRPLIRAIDIS